MTTPLIVTTSWDDGYPADVKTAEVLASCGATGTFYVPTRNAEGRPVLQEETIRELSCRFEIGGHSIDHIVLTGLSPSELDRQVRENKQWLESITTSPVRGFCYVRGRYNAAVTEAVRNAGYAYARTVENLNAGLTGDPYRVPVTLQLYPHSPLAYAKMLRHGGVSVARLKSLWTALSSRDLAQRVERLAMASRAAGGYFHLWGHSWELEELNLWNKLREVLNHLAGDHGAEFLTNHDALVRLRVLER
ncbi:MAG: polysaccharide deacetylase family protein [Alphaproteobacteria bacterium]|nr:polysaccharide deacetylase family protein [Alphaproteobacteria bacterium]